MSQPFIEKDFSLIVNVYQEESEKGNLARQFANVLVDFQGGNTSLEEKNNLANSIFQAFELSEASSNVEVSAWIEDALFVVLNARQD